MNRDIHSIFEAYKTKRAELLSEAPVMFEPEYKGSGEEVKAEFPELAKGKYALTPEQTAAAFTKFVEKFKAMGGSSPKLYKDFYEMEISPIVREVNPSVNNTNAKYAARVLYNALKAAKVVKDERDGVEGVKKAKGMPSQAGIQKLARITAENPERFEDEEAAVEKPVSKVYNSNAEYYFKTIDEIPSGTLQGDMKIQYERLSNLTGETMTGGEFEKQIQRYNLPTNLVSKFVKLDIMTTLSPEEGGGDEFKSEEDVIRDITGFGERPTSTRGGFGGSDSGPGYVKDLY
jgi:hypothetical protein